MELTDEEAERLEQQSRENMVYFYRRELLQIIGGKRAIIVLSVNARIRLTKYGLLTKRRGAPVGKRSGIGSGGAYFVTPLGKEMITRCQVAPLERTEVN